MHKHRVLAHTEMYQSAAVPAVVHQEMTSEQTLLVASGLIKQICVLQIKRSYHMYVMQRYTEDWKSCRVFFISQ